MTIQYQYCKQDISDDPEWDLEDGLLDQYITKVIHPEDSIAVSQTWYYCNPSCFVNDHIGVEVQCR